MVFSPSPWRQLSAGRLFPPALVKTTALGKLKARVEGPSLSSRPHGGEKRRSEGQMDVFPPAGGGGGGWREEEETKRLPSLSFRVVLLPSSSRERNSTFHPSV